MKGLFAKDANSRSVMVGVLIILLLAGLPLAVWLDLTSLAEANLRRQAGDLNSVVSSVHGYYASNVVGRVRCGLTG
jgi:adenylate cyclase